MNAFGVAANLADLLICKIKENLAVSGGNSLRYIIHRKPRCCHNFIQNSFRTAGAVPACITFPA